MSQLTRQRIRLAVDTARYDQIKDVRTAAAPILWRGNDVEFEIGLFRGADLLDVSNFASMTLELKTNDITGITGTPLMSRTISGAQISNVLTAQTWTDETAQHALFAFAGSETNLSLGGELEQVFYLVISGTTNDSPSRLITFGFALVKIKECGVAGTGEPPAPLAAYYTAAQSDARYLQTTGLGDNIRIKTQTNGDVFLQLRDISTNAPGFRTIYFIDGVLQIGPLEAA